jgi:TonB-linked SusC/RagA family outer membrane protein
MKMTLLVDNLLFKKTLLCLGMLTLFFIPGEVFAQNAKPAHLASGKVVDPATGQGVPGVSVKIKGSDKGTVTDSSGIFSLPADEKATLLFSHVGYDPVEISSREKTGLVVRLQVSTKGLNEVIVIGYGTQKKALSTAAVSTISPQEIAEKPVVNLTNDLVGRASGLIITQGSGEPGFDGSNIMIRGIGSIGGTQPLFIVDGVPRDFSRLDPNTIATMTILKDAAAVAPYGVAGANGVILITTKQGKSGRPTLDYNGYVGIQNPTKLPKFVNSYQYAQMRNEADVNDGQPLSYTPQDIELFRNHTDPDGHSDGHPLQDIIIPNRPLTYNNLGLSGGNDDIKYFASAGYTTQDAMWTSSHLKKYNGSLSLTAKATKTTTVGVSVNGYVEDQYFPSVGSGSIINQAQRQAPTTPIYYSNGLWSGYIGQSLIGEIYHSGYQFNENTAWYTQIYVDQKLPVKGLSAKAVVSYDNGPDPIFTGNQSSTQRIWSTPIPFYNVDTTQHPYAYNIGYQDRTQSTFTENFTQNHTLTLQGLLNYTGSFGKSDITAVGVVEERIVKFESFTATRINYNVNIDELNYGGPLASDATNGGYSSGEKQLGYVYRVGYAYDKKYLFEAAGRYDGSYLFAPGHRFGYFPAFSAGWRISEESFMQPITWIDNLKLRASWGASGAYPSSGGNVQTYQYLSPYNVYGNSAVLNGSATQGINEALQGNPNITWEKSKKTDVGFEASLWKGALGIEADYFYDKRSNMLVPITAALPAEYGIGIGLINGGVMANHGVDLTLTSGKTFSNGLALDIRGTFTFAQNKLLQIFENAATFDNPNRRQTGRPYNTQFGLKAIGLYSQGDFSGGNLKAGLPVPSYGGVQAGDIQYADLNKDGKIDNNDITDIGHPNTPEIIYGLEPRLTYKHFYFDVLFQGSGISDIFVNNYFVWPFNGSGSATTETYDDHWTPTHTNARYPALHTTPTSNNTQESSWWMRNDSYIRMKSFELGYTFPRQLIGHGIQALRLYISGQNVFTWTPWMKEQIDPENSGANQNYYQQRVLSVGLNATF